MNSKSKKQIPFLLLAISACFGWDVSIVVATEAQTNAPAKSTPAYAAPGAGSNAPDSNPVPPPSGSAKRSAADLEKLVAPIALYPDPLIATMLPASVYPLEIVQAARFVADTNNLAKLDEQTWDDNVKAVARVPDAIKKMNEDLSWTMELGEAFLAQDKDVIDAIQNMRGKAQKAGTLQTTPQQTVVITNTIVEKTVEEKVVVVTNTVVQIQPASSTTVYVPTYNPTTVYYPPPAYVANPYPLMTFGAGMAMGAIIANNVDWHGGGCYHGDVDVNVDRNVNKNVNRNSDRNTDRSRQNTQSGTRASGTSQKKWQPDQSRLNKSGAPSSASSASRGWSGGSPSDQRASSANAGTRSTSAGTGARSPSTGGARPSASTGASRPSASQGAANTRSPSASSSARSSSGASRPSPSASSRSSSSGGSAFSGVSSGSSARSASSRGSSSRGGGGGGGGGRGGGGGGRR